MNLQAHYDALRQVAIRRLGQGEADLDPLIDSVQDSRRGISLLARPPAHITKAIEEVLADFRLAEPGQYYYPATDIHLTIMSIISCYSGFTLGMIDPAQYRRAVGAILQHVRPFTITFTGLTASPGGVMVQGVPQDNTLENLRNELRHHFRHSGLQQSIDQRYHLHTAHSTVIRFRRKLHNARALAEKIDQYQRYFFGSFEVNAVELVFNDWYQRAANTVLLEKYFL